MRAIVVIGLIVLGVGRIGAPTAHACVPAVCTCLSPERNGEWRPFTEAELRRSRAVFLGTVDTVLTGPRRGRFRVIRWFKGGSADTVTVQEEPELRGDNIRSSCGRDFRRVATVLVFADARPDGALHIGNCSATRTGPASDSILKYLGVGWAPGQLGRR